MVALILLLAGCAPLLLVEGAIPVAPGSSTSRVTLGAAREPDAWSTPTGMVLPTFGFTRRFGLRPDTDLGLHAYTLGLGVDVRRRIVDQDGWSVAVAPGFTGMFLPVPGLQYATLDFALPLRVERPIGDRFSVAGGPGVILRQTFVAVTTGEISSVGQNAELLAGGALRGQVRLGKLWLGLAGAAYVDVLRGAGVYGGAAVDLGWQPVARPSDGYGEHP